MKRYKMLGVGKTTRGYTIVEALIFLAVSGALLVSAATLISGRQERTRFSQAIDDVSQNLQDIFNDTSTGFYPSANNLRCVDLNGSPTVADLQITEVSNTEQGTNKDCVFSGKLINFPANSTNYNIYTMITARESTAFIGSHTKLAGAGVINAGIFDTRGNTVDVRTNRVVIKPINYPVSPRVNINSLVVVSDFGSSSGEALTGNAGKLKLYGYNNGAINSSPLTTTVALAGLVNIPSDSQVIICLSQGGSDASRRGYISITPQLTLDRIVGSQDPACA